jgi:hypothetical protein
VDKLSTRRHVYLCCHVTPEFQVNSSFSFLRFVSCLEARRDRSVRCLPVAGGAARTTV